MSAKSVKASTGIILPLYIYPGASWKAVIQAKKSCPSVPILAIINPGNGPGAFQDTNYVSGIKELQSVEVTVLGYVFTAYASRSKEEAVSEINTYMDWYHVDGIMFDEMSVSLATLEYYSALGQYAKSLGMVMTVGNPGKVITPSYISSMDVLNIYEDHGIPLARVLANSLSSEKRSIIAYGVSDFDRISLKAISKRVAFLYMTDAELPNPYNRLPTYFSRMVEALDPSEALSSSGESLRAFT